MIPILVRSDLSAAHQEVPTGVWRQSHRLLRRTGSDREATWHHERTPALVDLDLAMPNLTPMDIGRLQPIFSWRFGGADSEVLIGIGLTRKTHLDDGFPTGPTHYSAVWCIHGEAVYDDGLIRREIRPGMVVQRFPGRPHRLDLIPGSGWTECWVALGTNALGTLAGFRIIDPNRPVLEVPIDVGLLMELHRAGIALTEAEESHLPRHVPRIIGLLADLLGRDDARPGAHTRALIDQACRRLATEPRLDLRALANDLGLGYERFRKVFGDVVGMAPRDYRIIRRIGLACALLNTTQGSIAEIADQLGYANPFIFSAQFRKVMGHPPSAYRHGPTGMTAPRSGRPLRI